MYKIYDYMSIEVGGHLFSIKKDFFEFLAYKYFTQYFEIRTC